MVGRWDPLTGQLMARVEVPALNVTSCAFGGPNLDILYITSSSQGMRKEIAAKYPDAGDLFKVRPEVTGVQADFWGN
jgi:sugar lactone lactonase YvrE